MVSRALSLTSSSRAYSLSSSFNAEAMVVNEAGITVTHRLDDRKSEITIEGIAKTSSIPVLGATLTFTVNTASAYPAWLGFGRLRRGHHEGRR